MSKLLKEGIGKTFQDKGIGKDVLKKKKKRLVLKVICDRN